MGGAQTMLTIGSLVLLSSVILTLNSAILGREGTQYESEAILTATSLAQSLLEEIRTRSFDEQTVQGSRITDPTYLTSPYGLGSDAGEVSEVDFDDVDDYHGFRRIVTTSRLGDFNEEAEVYYVRGSYPVDSLVYQSYLKRVDVRVTNSYIGTPGQSTTQTITLTTVIGYR